MASLNTVVHLWVAIICKYIFRSVLLMLLGERGSDGVETAYTGEGEGGVLLLPV